MPRIPEEAERLVGLYRRDQAVRRKGNGPSPGQDSQNISRRIIALETNPRPPAALKLQGGDGYRFRVGDYRVLYTIDDATRRVFIYSVAHRREAYR
ncbi:MAG TPA: type II toxin-antitoxin system RelE/ParE family toxin [Candidatus Binatia bacterium]